MADIDPTQEVEGVQILFKEIRNLRTDLIDNQRYDEKVNENFNNHLVGISKHLSGIRQSLGCLVWAVVVIPLLTWIFVGCGALASVGAALGGL